MGNRPGAPSRKRYRRFWVPVRAHGMTPRRSSESACSYSRRRRIFRASVESLERGVDLRELRGFTRRIRRMDFLVDRVGTEIGGMIRQLGQVAGCSCSRPPIPRWYIAELALQR